MVRRSRFRRRAIGLVLLVIAAAGIFLMFPRTNGNAPGIPDTEVRLGDFVEYVQVRGEIRARTSTFILAPFNAGDLQILRLCKDGTLVKRGDVIVEFDPTSLQRTVDQSKNTLRQLDAQIARIKAQQLLRDEQSLTDRVMAEFGVERATLDASKGPVVAAAENEKNRLALGKAKMKLLEVEQQMASNRVGAEADLAGILRKREKANLDLEQAQQRMAALTLTTPVDGLIMLQPNSRARATGTSTVPTFKEGDRAYAGAAIAELPDLSTVQVNAPVDEADRGKVDVDQPASVRVDAVPDRELKGKVGAIGSMARIDITSLLSRKFDMTVMLDQIDPRLRPGMSATVRIAVLRLPNSILIPTEAIFDRNARPVAYVRSGGRFEERAIEVARQGDGVAMVARGLKPGERVALKNPTLEKEPQK